MNIDAGRSRVGWHARVVTGVAFLRLGYDQHTTGAVVVDFNASLLVVVDHAVLVIPEQVHWRLGALSKCAHQFQRAAALNVQVRRP